MTLAMKAFLPLTLVVLSDGPGHPVRLPGNPIVTPASSPTLGENINGPSLIRVPEWVERPLGRYYLYFAHHAGKFIRLAYADRLSGPWRIHEPGTLRLEQAQRCYDHIASPDMHVDSERREILMYFHCPAGASGKLDIGQQKTFLAVSPDGLRFAADTLPLGPAYFRVFRRGEYYYTVFGAAASCARAIAGRASSWGPRSCLPIRAACCDTQPSTCVTTCCGSSTLGSATGRSAYSSRRHGFRVIGQAGVGQNR